MAVIICQIGAVILIVALIILGVHEILYLLMIGAWAWSQLRHIGKLIQIAFFGSSERRL